MAGNGITRFGGLRNWQKTLLKGQKREMVFLTNPSCPGFQFFYYFGRTLAAFSVLGECAKIF
jgi:hypothetical protein